MNTSFSEKFRKLSEVLNKSVRVRSYDEGDEIQAGTLAHAFLDLSESFSNLSETCLPKLFDGSKSPEEIEDILHAVGKEFRNILYHIKDCKYYGYLIEE